MSKLRKKTARIRKSWRVDYLFGMFPSTSEQAGRLDTVVSNLLFMTIDLAEAIPEKRWENINLLENYQALLWYIALFHEFSQSFKLNC